MSRALAELEYEVVPHVRLEDEEADAILRRNFLDQRYLYYENPDGTVPNHKGAHLTDRLLAIRDAYRLTEENAGPVALRAWYALQNAAFVVKQDLLKLAQYVAVLEEENRRLQAQQG
jgi:hypothetical protein